MAASFPDKCLQAKLSSLNITGKSVIILKIKGTAEMHRFHCMPTHIGN